MSANIICKKLSVIIPVCERTDATASLFSEYHEQCSKLSPAVEYIYVVTINHPDVITELRSIKLENDDLTLIVLNRNYGEATAIQAGYNQATGDYILTLPPYKQVKSEEFSKLVKEIGEHDIALGRRWPRHDGKTNQIQTRLFNFLLEKFSGQKFSDIGCSVRLIKTEALKETYMYGDQWRFFPLLAYQLGFHSVEVNLTQAKDDSYSRVYNPGTYLRRLLDLLTIIFLTKFNKKPLRFFGLLGSSSIIASVAGLLYLAFDRLVFDVAISDRPLLVLFSLFFVLGAQLIAIGLVGETVIFTHAKDNKEYKIKEIVSSELR
jgi:glycosyltransferase involved in cell wall biosynthesis